MTALLVGSPNTIATTAFSLTLEQRAMSNDDRFTRRIPQHDHNNRFFTNPRATMTAYLIYRSPDTHSSSFEQHSTSKICLFVFLPFRSFLVATKLRMKLIEDSAMCCFEQHRGVANSVLPASCLPRQKIRRTYPLQWKLS